MKRPFLIYSSLLLALVLSLFTSCDNREACDISLKGTSSGTVAFENSAEKKMKFLAGDTVKVVATPKKNCDFFGWYVGKEKTPRSKDAKYTFVASESVTLVAKFGKSPVVSISSSSNGNASFADFTEKSKVFPYGTAVNLVATPDKDCEFLGWYAGDSKVCDDVNYTFKASKNIALVAKFKKSPVVTISNSEDGRAAFTNSSKNSMAVLTGNKVSVVATPDADCEFEGWFVGESKVSTDSVYTFAVSKNISLVAKFYPSPIVSISSNDKGRVAFTDSSDDTVVVLLGHDITVAATPNKHCEFAGWYVDNAKVSGDSVYTFAVQENTFLVAKFNLCPVVSISGGDNGSVAIANVSGNSHIVYSGTNVTVTATPDKGYELFGWFVGDSKTPVSKELAYTFAVNENVKLHAVFKMSLNGYEYVDLGLPSGLKWAKYNVGADVPEAYGSYIAWGETNAKDDYSWATYKYYDSSFNTITKYCSNERYGAVDSKEALEVKDDAANVNWGRTWRMPTAAEFDELYQVCTWEWTSINDVPGYKVTGPNGNEIFLPAAGYKNATNVLNKNGAGYYWSSTLLSKSNGRACYMIFDKESRKNDDYSRRYSGRSVRPVFE